MVAHAHAHMPLRQTGCGKDICSHAMLCTHARTHRPAGSQTKGHYSLVETPMPSFFNYISPITHTLHAADVETENYRKLRLILGTYIVQFSGQGGL